MAHHQSQQQRSVYQDTYLPVESTIKENAAGAACWKATEQSLNTTLNNVFKHHLLLNQHAADGSEIISEVEKTNMFVLYLLDFLCSKSFVVKEKRNSGNVDVDGDVRLDSPSHRQRRKKRKRRKKVRQQQPDMHVSVSAKIQGINVDTQLPEYVGDGNVLSEHFKNVVLADESTCVYWTCNRSWVINALRLSQPVNAKFMTTEICKDQCFVIPIIEPEELEIIQQADWNEENLIKAVSPFTTNELQGMDADMKFVQSVTQKRAILDALDTVPVPLNDEDELLLVGQVTIREAAGDLSWVFASLRKGHSLVHINLKNALSFEICEDDVASSDVSRLIPLQWRDNIIQVTCLSFTQIYFD